MRSEKLLEVEKLVNMGTNPKLADFDELIFAPYHGLVSDFYLVADWYVCAKINGLVYKISERKLGKDVVSELVKTMTSTTKYGDIMNGYADSWTHRVSVKGLEGQLRFRCAAGSGQSLHGLADIDLVMRPIINDPKDLYNMGLDKGLTDHIFPEDGLVLLSGPTGSGKTTILAAVEKVIAQVPGGKILATVEDPIEYNLHGIKDRTGFISQAELGRNFKSFSLAMRHLLRKNPDVIVCGELRDIDTIRITTEAANTGHAVYGTTHTNAAATIFSRIGGMFPPIEQTSVIEALIKSSRVFFHQRLYTTHDKKGRVAVYEYIVFTETHRANMDRVYKTHGMARLTEFVQNLVESDGLSLVESARNAYESEKLGLSKYEEIVNKYKMDLDAAIETDEEVQKRNMDEKIRHMKIQEEQTAAIIELLASMKETQKMMVRLLENNG
jgi:defect in organelle trafficking protein DotB